ncbi:MAG: hypothetical protein DMG42_30015 [Acidobacteria bacterium]|nr:MAG: hypothetical protein DMG42_30015 [Acidobacteriota bacterium]
MALRPLSQVSCVVCIVLLPVLVQAQQPTGTITGVVRDPSGAIVPGASITIVHEATQSTTRATTSNAGVYSAPGLLPGLYKVCVEATGFKQTVVELEAEVGRVKTADVSLQVGDVTQTVTIVAYGVRVNPTQTSLEGIVTEELIHNLPLNGRNFLDLGQLEPGVQVVPDDIITRSGFARLSVAGQTGVTTRVTVDGLDVSDEHAGSLALNLSADSIKEFQISRSTFDVSTGLTGSGAVNIVTKSGSNELHGSAFLLWRDDAFAARIGQEPTAFDREQAGFDVGGPFIRNRLFWFLNYERNNQDAAVVTNIPLFPQFSRTWPSPSDERMATARLDWNVTGNLRAFFRFTYDGHEEIPGSTFGGVRLAPIAVATNARQTALGLDATVGRFTHSVRLGYTNYDNTADPAGQNVPGVPETVDPAGRLLTVTQAQGPILIGTHPNSSIRRYQDTHEMRYDAGFSVGRHGFRGGVLVNIVRINWFDSAFGNAPQVNLNFSPASVSACRSDILCYPVQNALFGNGLGYFSEVPSLSQPYGGARNNRVHWYVGDSWRAHPRLTLNLGLRWVYEPGPSNPGLQRPKILDDFLPGLSRANRSDTNNFAPQFGIAWAPSASGKWLIRTGAGVFYDVNRLQNALFGERANLLPLGVTWELQGRMLRDPITHRVIFDLQGRNWLPQDGGPALITPGVNWMGRPLGTPGLLDAVFAAHEAFKAAYQVAFANFPAGLSACEVSRNCTTLAPGYETPYSFQFNIGVQRELRPGLVLSVDYVRNRSLHFLMQHNANRNGAADTLDIKRALSAMNAVHASIRPTPCPAGPTGVDCAVAAGARLTTYTNAGLGSTATASISGPSNSAFPGINPNFNGLFLLSMNGFSNYNALQVNLRGRLPSVGRLVKEPSVVASYALSRLEGTAEDQAVLNVSDRVDNDNPLGFRGPTSLDRKHILSLASLFTIPGGVRLNSIWRVFSALPQTLSVPQVSGAGAEIFLTDFNGDGNALDVLPGTNRGSYGRKVGCGSAALNRVIDAYNSKQAGNLTPAGQALVNAGLFTESQLKALGAVSPTVHRAPDGQVCLDSFITTDMRIARPFKLRRERITIEPALEWFNLFNVANYDLPDNKLRGALDTSVGSLNGTTASNRPNRAGGTGSFVLGAPRSWQLALRISF